jgi:signal transduction histidine kinase
MSPRRWVLTPPITAGFMLAFLLFLVAGRGGYEAEMRMVDISRAGRHDRLVLEQSQRVITRLIAAETAQRGYLLTGAERELMAYEEARRALPADLATFTELVADSPDRQRLVASLTPAIEARLSELGDTIEVRRREGAEAAIRAFSTDRGSESLGRIRWMVDEFQHAELSNLQRQRATVDDHRVVSRALILTATFLGALLAGGALLALNRQTRQRMVSEAERERLVRADAAHAEAARASVERALAAERAKAEREALLRLTEQARAEAEGANRAKDEFLAVLSHELRSPLHAMVGWLSILKKGMAAGRNVDRAVQTIERNVRLQGQLVNDLLDVSRIVSRKLAIEEEPVDLTMNVHNVVETARPAAEAKGVALECSATELPGPVLGDEQRLLQMVLNLVNNAVKFTPSGGQVAVTLTCAAGEASLVVADTGEGIAPDFLPHVFDQFRQADATITRRHGGLGIGLAIAKTLAELHGGRIEARSEGLGAGATFTVHIPLRAAVRALPEAMGVAAGAQSALQGRTVLVLEDDPDGRDALCLALEQTGAQVHGCASADEARRLLQALSPDVIVSDEFVRWVRARAGDYVPAVAITGLASAQDREEAARAGFDAHLAKPVNLDQLIAKLQDLMRGSGPRWPRSGVLPRTARQRG